MVYYSFFFFSSRRRHTRLQGDWSSDVCSSDLRQNENLSVGGNARAVDVIGRRAAPIVPDDKVRSEERRVGKECRSRRWAYHEKKKKQRRTERADAQTEEQRGER